MTSRIANWTVAASLLVLLAVAGRTSAQQLELVPVAEGTTAAAESNERSPKDVLTPEQWQRVDVSVDRALLWLASQQQPDGSFPSIDTGQPGVTCLCMLAFMAHGHLPGEGPYGGHLDRATDYVLSCQKNNGLISLNGPDGPRLSRNIAHEIGVAASYNHAIASLVLSELYGMSGGKRAADIQKVINQALPATLEMQRWPKDQAVDRGGWRYIDDFDRSDSDLSVTGWYLMSLRSARNAGFDVPKEPIDEAVAYIRRCYGPEFGAFEYTIGRGDDRSRGMAGAGILALAHAGFHNAPEAKQSGQWILRYNFDRYNEIEPFTQSWFHDRYHYGLFNCCQGMYQLGGPYWEQFFPRTVRTLLANQQRNGSWPAESHFHDAQFGNSYTTALVVMSLGAPNQLLPVFQR